MVLKNVVLKKDKLLKKQVLKKCNLRAVWDWLSILFEFRYPHLFFSKKRWKIFSCDQTIIYEDISHKNVSGFPALDILWLTYLRVFSQTTLTRFAQYWPPTHPLLTFVMEFFYWNKRESAYRYHFKYHSTNVVFDRPLRP